MLRVIETAGLGVMTSKVDVPTKSELDREAARVRRQIEETAKKAEELMRTTAKFQFFVDQLFRFFAPGVKSEEDKQALVEIIISSQAAIYVGQLPLLPIAFLMANGRLPGAQRIFAQDNPKVDDRSVIFLAHVLRFSPQATQVDYVDISRTSVTARGLFYMVEMMIERGRKFTLEALEVIPEFKDPNSVVGASPKVSKNGPQASDSAGDPCLLRLVEILKDAKEREYCVIHF